MNVETLRLGKERSAIRELFEYGIARKKEIGEENVFDFSIGNPGIPAPPCVKEEIERLLCEVPAEDLHGYTSAPGLFSARKAVSDYIGRTFGVPSSPDLVYMTCGASASLAISFKAMCEEGDEVILLAPFFPEYAVFVKSAGGVPVTVQTDGRFRPDPAAIERAITGKTRALLVNSPNNPSGAVYTEEEFRAIAEVLRRKSAEIGRTIFLVADEPYRELCFTERAPVYPMSVYENTLVLYSFSKSLSLAGERIGYIAVSPKCDGAEELFFSVCGAGRSLGYVCAPALFQRVIERCLGKVTDVSYYRENRDLLLHALRADGFACIEPEGAFYLFVKAPKGDAAEFAERAKRHELLVVPSDSFGSKGYVRVSYCVKREIAVRSLPAFAALAEEYGL